MTHLSSELVRRSVVDRYGSRFWLFCAVGGGIYMHWTYLLLAILLEVAGTVCLKLSDSFTRLVPSLLVVVFYALACVALAGAMKKIDISVAYAIWGGIGSALLCTAGVLFFRESFTMLKALCIVLILMGTVGLNLLADRA